MTILLLCRGSKSPLVPTLFQQKSTPIWVHSLCKLVSPHVPNVLDATRMLPRCGSASIWINHVSFNTRVEYVMAGSYGFDDSMLVKERHCLPNDVVYERHIANGESSALATAADQEVDIRQPIKEQPLDSVWLLGQRKALYHCLQVGHRSGDVEISFEPID